MDDVASPKGVPSRTITVDLITWERLKEYAKTEGLTIREAANQLIEFGELSIM